MSEMKNRDSVASDLEEFEKSLVNSEKNKIVENTVPTEEEWDNTVVPGATLTPAPESFVIPIDAPDGKLKSTREANTYAAKKTVAQGMMDIALITANANQLRYIVEYTSNSKTYYFNLFLISLSLFIQVAVGIALIFKGQCDLRGESKFRHARRANNFIVIGVFSVTIINVFIASFTITGTNNIPTISFPVNNNAGSVPNGSGSSNNVS